jgi:cell shape-determining protein MreC
MRTWRAVVIILMVACGAVPVQAQETAPEPVPAAFLELKEDVAQMKGQLTQLKDVALVKEQQGQQTKLLTQLQAAIAQVQAALTKPSTEAQAETLVKSLESGEAEIAPACKAKKRKPFVAFAPIDGKVVRIVGCMP